MGRRYGSGKPKPPRTAGIRFRYWWEQNAPSPLAPTVRLLHVRSGRTFVISDKWAKVAFTRLFYSVKIPRAFLDGVEGEIQGPLAADYRAFEDLVVESRYARLHEYAEKTGRKDAGLPRIPRDGDFQILNGPPPPETPVRLVVGAGLHKLRGKVIWKGMAAFSLRRSHDRRLQKLLDRPEEDRAPRAALLENRLKRAMQAFEDAQSEYNRVYAEVRSRPETYTLGDLYRDYPQAR